MPPKLGKTRHSNVDKRIEYLGSSKQLAEDDLPTVRACLRYGIYLREQQLTGDGELSVSDMAIGIYRKVAGLYFKANAKLVPPVIIPECAAVGKIVGIWIDVNTIVRKQKSYKNIQTRIEPQLDKLFDLMYCK